jgi:hypothetical protein
LLLAIIVEFGSIVPHLPRTQTRTCIGLESGGGAPAPTKTTSFLHKFFTVCLYSRHIFETITGVSEMSNKRVAMRMVLVMVLVGAFLLAVVPAMAATDSAPSDPLGIQNETPGPGGRGNGGQPGGYNGSNGGQQNGNSSGAGTGFVDADGDGICDNCGTAFVDADGDGICDNCTGTGYVDADGDGICDNTGIPAYSGSGAQRGNGGGRGRAR